MPVPGARLCGAKCKNRDRPCLMTALKDSERCKMHFGYSRNQLKHGKSTNKARRERSEQAKLLREIKQVNSEIEDGQETGSL